MNKGGFSWRRLSGVSRTKSRISRAIGVPLTKSGRQRKFGAAIGKLAGSGKQANAGAATGCLILVIMLNLVIVGTGVLAGCNSVGVKKSMTASELEEGHQWHKAGFATEEAILWQDSGFTVEEAKEWRKIGSSRVYVSIQSQIEDAKEWKDSGFTAEEMGKWHKKNFTIEDAKKVKLNMKTLEATGLTSEEAAWFSEVEKISPEDARKIKEFLTNEAAIEEIHGWIKIGLSFKESLEWSYKGILPEEAASWLSFGYSAADAKREIKEQVSVNKAGYDNRDVYLIKELRTSSPYSVKGKYYYLDCAEGIQLLDQFNGIYNIGSYNGHQCFVLLKFKGQDAPPPGSEIKVKAKGAGVFKYTSAMGVFQTIPILEVFAIKKQQINNPFWPNGD